MRLITIPLNVLNCPNNITNKMKQYGIKDYTYMFFNEICFDIGMSCDQEWQRGTYGSRIYRKAAGIDGWPQTINCTSSDKQREKIKQAQANGNLINLTKDDVTIIVMDYTKDLEGKFDNERVWYLRNQEDKLVKEYEEEYGCKPVLNIGKTYTNPGAYQTFNELFNFKEAA